MDFSAAGINDNRLSLLGPATSVVCSQKMSENSCSDISAFMCYDVTLHLFALSAKLTREIQAELASSSISLSLSLSVAPPLTMAVLTPNHHLSTFLSALTRLVWGRARARL